MKTREIEFANDFHNTTTRARARRIGPNCWRISERVMKHVEHELCGMRGCTCGVLRGKQRDPLAVEMWEAYQICRVARPIGVPRRRLGEFGRAAVLS